MEHSKFISILLIGSAINLTMMIPGGFIESRDFSHIHPLILGGFNIFLTLLGMLSLFIPYLFYKRDKRAGVLSFICGLAYFIVYLIDIVKIFPTSPTPMPVALLALEVLGVLLAIPLMILVLLTPNTMKSDTVVMGKAFYRLIGIALIISLGIIIFATKSAMTSP